MTYYEAVLFLHIAMEYKADVKVNNSVYSYFEDAEEDADENIQELAINLVNWAERDGSISLVMENGETKTVEELGIVPILFEDEIAIILEKFANKDSVVTIHSPYADGRETRELKIVKDINYFSRDKYSVSVVYEIYNAMENDYIISINDKDIMELRKNVEY